MKFLLAFILGLIIPFIALFIGLQVSPSIANILLTPIAILSTFFDESFGNMSTTTHALLVFSSAIFYFLLFYITTKLIFPKGKENLPNT